MEKAGEGISGMLDGRIISVGRPVDNEKYSSLMDSGETIVEYSRNGIVAGYISVSDPVKSDSAAAIGLIKGLGIIPVMLTRGQAKGQRWRLLLKQASKGS